MFSSIETFNLFRGYTDNMTLNELQLASEQKGTEFSAERKKKKKKAKYTFERFVQRFIGRNWENQIVVDRRLSLMFVMLKLV